MRLVIKTVKGLALYLVVLSVVTAGAAVIGCLFLSNGKINYLFDPKSLFFFLWVTRAGLKATIFFLTTVIFLMIVSDGVLGRRWF